KGILHEILNRMFDDGSAANIEIDFRIQFVDVNRRMQFSCIHLKDCGNTFHDGCGPAGMAEHRFCRIELELFSMAAKDALNRPDLGHVSKWSRCRVSADVIDLL